VLLFKILKKELFYKKNINKYLLRLYILKRYIKEVFNNIYKSGYLSFIKI
jgi:hypothetical protein